MSIKKNIRFEIFKRDDFRCQYCGRQVPNTVLEIDHIIPASEGGGDSPGNLITSCFDCNRGKSGTPLNNKKLTSFTDQKELLENEMIQRKAYEELLKEKQWEIENDYQNAESYIGNELLNWDEFEDEEINSDLYIFTAKVEKTIKQFLKRLMLLEIVDAIDIASLRMTDKSNEEKFKYFRGICYNKIAEKNGDFSKHPYKNREQENND